VQRVEKSIFYEKVNDLYIGGDGTEFVVTIGDPPIGTIVPWQVNMEAHC
jgi:hypothetical protein